MQNTFGLEIYAANRQFFAGRARSLIIPAEDGQKEFLAHHANMICAIVPGELKFEDSEGNWVTVAVSSGFVEMINNRAKLFCLTVERPRRKSTSEELKRLVIVPKSSSVSSRVL